ncbi:MAG: hypothetical protein SNG59_07130 [Rikenellaceae bacterium]
MKKNYFLRGRFLCAVALAGVLLMAPTSCVDDTYDLDKGLDMSMSLGGSLGFPLGSTEPILLGDMLDTDEIEQLEAIGESGLYKISMADVIEIDLSSLTETEVAIEGIENVQVIESALETPTFPSFALSVSPSTIDVNPALDQVSTGDAVPLAQNITIAPTYPTALKDILSSGYATGQEIDKDEPKVVEFGFVRDPVELNVGADITQPDQVISFQEIRFGSDGSDEGVVASVVLDLSPLANLFQEDKFFVELEYVEIAFPEGFVISESGSHIYRLENLENEGDNIEFDFTIEKFVFEEGEGLEALNGNVSTDIAEEIMVWGTLSGTTIDESANMTLDVNSSIEVADMTFTVSQVETEIEGSLLSGDDPVTIELTDLITDVNWVSLVDGENVIEISINSIESILPPSGDPIQILFPATKFEIIESDEVKLVEDSYVLEIPLTSLVNGDGFDADVVITKILFDEEITVVDSETESNYLEFDPEITMTGTILYMGDAEGSQITLSAYNEFAVSEQAILTQVSDDELEVEDADIEIGGYDIELDPMTTLISESIDLPEELTRIDYMTFAESVYLTIDVDVELTGLDESDLKFNKYTITFPEFLVFDESVGTEEGITLDEDNKMTINSTFDVSEDGSTRYFYRQFEVTQIDLSNVTIENGNLSLNEEILLEGALALDGGDVDIDALSDVIIANVSYSLDEMSVDKVYGLFSPDLPADSEEFDLSSLSDAMEGELTLVLTDPTIVLTATNTLEIPILIDYVRLSPTKDGEPTTKIDENGDESDIYISTPEAISIGAAVNGEATTTVIHLVNYEVVNSMNSDGVTYVQLSDFGYLLSGLPNSLAMEYSASVSEEQTHMIDLNREEAYSFTLDYSLDVPLTFDELSFDYEVVMDGLGESLESVLDYISALDINMEIENTLPISLSISELTPIDASGDEITSLGSILVGDGTIAALATSELGISLADNADGDLKLIDGFKIHIEASATSTEGGVDLCADQYLVISMSAALPEGITIDLSSDEE